MTLIAILNLNHVEMNSARKQCKYCQDPATFWQ